MKQTIIWLVFLLILHTAMYADVTKPIGMVHLTAEIHSKDENTTTGFLYIKGNNIQIVPPIPVHFSPSSNPQTAGNYIGTFTKIVDGHPVTYYVYLSGASPRMPQPIGPIKQA